MLPPRARRNWLWWNLPAPAARNNIFADLVEDNPKSVRWHTPAQTRQLLGMMSSVNRQKVEKAKRAGRTMVGCIYKRTRRDETRQKVQRAEVRFDDIAGCLRTPAGGSSRQLILVVIPTVIDQNPCAHLRMPRDMIFHGWSMRLFQAWQHSATMSS